MRTTAIGSGSIAQVFKAEREGNTYASKVVDSRVRGQLEKNFELLDRVLTEAENQPLRRLVDNLRQKSLEETDLRNEASNLETARAQLRGSGIEVPRVERSGETALVMQHVDGVSAHKIEELGPAQRRKIASRLFAAIAYQVMSGGIAETAGLKAGDVIVKVNGRDMSSLDQSELAALLQSSPVTLTVERDDREIDIELKRPG